MERRRGPKSAAEREAWRIKRAAFRAAHDLAPRCAHTGDVPAAPLSIEQLARNAGLRFVDGRVG